MSEPQVCMDYACSKEILQGKTVSETMRNIIEEQMSSNLVCLPIKMNTVSISFTTTDDQSKWLARQNEEQSYVVRALINAEMDKLNNSEYNI